MKSIITSALAVALTATAAQAALPPPREVDVQIRDVIASGLDAGYRRVIADQRISMPNDGRSVSFKVRLERGVEYGFAGRCDSDCFDLDMVLRDASGRVWK